jgi:hypothetical protein
MATSVAFSVFQVMVTDWPGCTLDGVASIEAVGAGGGGGAGGAFATGVLLGQADNSAMRAVANRRRNQNLNGGNLNGPGASLRLMVGRLHNKLRDAIIRNISA